MSVHEPRVTRREAIKGALSNSERIVRHTGTLFILRLLSTGTASPQNWRKHSRWRSSKSGLHKSCNRHADVKPPAALYPSGFCGVTTQDKTSLSTVFNVDFAPICTRTDMSHDHQQIFMVMLRWFSLSTLRRNADARSRSCQAPLQASITKGYAWKAVRMGLSAREDCL